MKEPWKIASRSSASAEVRLTNLQGPRPSRGRLGISKQRGPAPVAQQLYQETEESLRLKAQAAEQHRMGAEPARSLEHGRPTKRDRRSLDKAGAKDWDSRWSASAD